MRWNTIGDDGKWVKSSETPQERFWKKVEKSNSCWLWLGKKTQRGYGDFGIRIGSRTLNFRAHRYSWEMTKGRIPKGMIVCHNCDNPSCVNPNHLYLGTQSENIRESVEKGRHSTCFQNGESNPAAKLTKEIIKEIRESYVPRKFTQYDLAKRHNLSQSYISEILLEKVWKEV